MKGYIRNKTNAWTHAMKRAIGPGAKVSLDELYEQYGTKHKLDKGEDFANWLRTVKLKDAERWEVVLEVEVEEPTTKSKSKNKAKKKEVVEKVLPVIEAPPVKGPTIKEMGVEDVVQLSVRKAREVVPKITDMKLLKYALEEAGPRAGKDNLVRMLRKRIQELQISR